MLRGYTSGPGVSYGGSRAYYAPGRDVVRLPRREGFEGAHGYYATAFHELAHSTGHASRLNRGGVVDVAPLGSAIYSREELVAEFGAAFLSAEAGIDLSRLSQSASYIAPWLRVLKDDPRMVVIAASQGQRSADWILGNRQQEVVAA